MMPFLWKIVAILIISLVSSSLVAMGKPIEGEISIPIPFVSHQLFDYNIEKQYATYDPDSNPIIESINQDARNKYHLYHPTWKEFCSFQ